MSEPIRILQIVTYMGRGGLETMLMNYYRNVDRSRVQFDFLTHRSERHEYDDEIESLGGKIYRLPRLNPWSIQYRRALNQFFADHPEYKIVHCHQDCMSAIPLAAAQKAGVPVRIAHSHNSNQTRNVKYLLKLYYKRFIPRTATELFSCGEAAGKWMFGCDDFRVLPNAIDARAYCYNEKRREEARAEFHIGQDQLVIGHVGRFSPAKNHSFLIEIFAALHAMDPRTKLMLVGGGAGQKEIFEKVCSLGLKEHVVFTGIRSDVADCMQAMDVFVMPSLYEGLPVTMIEAQSSGLPCLISDKVPIECKKTDLVEQISLERDAEVWAKAALEASRRERRNTYQEIAASGFDIEENARWLQEFYLGLNGTN